MLPEMFGRREPANIAAGTEYGPPALTAELSGGPDSSYLMITKSAISVWKTWKINKSFKIIFPLQVKRLNHLQKNTFF